MTAEFLRTWAGIRHAITFLHLEWLIIEGDSLTVISWIRQAFRSSSAHPLISDIGTMLQRCMGLVIMHV